MKKTLLPPTSTMFPSLLLHPYKLLFSLLLLLSFSLTTQAQCGAYMLHESFKSTSTFAGTAIAPASSTNFSGGTWYGFTIGTNANGYSGTKSASFTNAASYMITPLQTVSGSTTLTVSFYLRCALANAVAGTIVAEYATPSQYTPGVTDPTSFAWTAIGTASNATATYTQFTGTFSPGAAGCYVRFRRTNATGGVPIIDDLSLSSSVMSENSIFVMPRQTVAGATSCSTVALPANSTYSFYDNGGFNDNYSGASPASINQDHTMTFMPAAGQQIELTMVSYNVAATPTGSITITNADTALTGYTTNALPATTVYTSVAGNGSVSVQFTATGTTGTGFEFTVKSKPIISTCSNIASSAVSNVTYNSADLSWPVPGTAPAGYDYYVSTTNSAPSAGALTASNTTALQAGYVAGGSTASYTVTGLASSTTYYAWVRSNCGSGYGSWVQITGSSFTTVCSPTVVPPSYIEDFEGSLVLPTCTSTTSGSYGIATASANNYFFNTSAGTYFFTKPLLLDPTKIYRLSFDYSNSTNSSTTVKAYYGKTSNAVSSANVTSLLGQVTTATSTVATARYYFQPNSNTTPYYIGIQLSTIAGGAFLLDNVKLEVVPCFPAATPVVAGSAVSCPATSLVFTATANGAAGTTTADGLSGATTTATGVTWTVPTGWVISSGQGTNSITAVSAVGTGVFITATGTIAGCDNSVTTNKPVASFAIPPQPGPITGSTTFCSLPQAGLTYSIAAVAGATSYLWSFPAGWTVTAGGTSATVTVTATAGAASGTITVTPKNASNCLGTPQTLAVVVGAVNNATCATATAITTSINDVVRCSATDYWYSFTPVCSGSHKITLTGSATDLDVYTYDVCGGPWINRPYTASSNETITQTLTAGVTIYIRVNVFSGNNQNFTVSVASTAVGTPGAIAGTGSVSCSASTTTTYSVLAVTGATTYTWTVPAGWTIDSGNGTTSITVTTGGTTGGLISVIASGPCGTSLPSTKNIIVGQLGASSISGSTGLCASVANTTYSITPVTGATAYAWTFPAGWTVVSGAGTTSITVTPSSTSGNVSVVVTGPCGDSLPTTLAVTTASAVTSTGASVCIGGTGTMSSVLSAMTSFAVADIPVGAPRFIRSSAFTASTTTYSSSGQNVIYTTQTIIPTVTGSYTFMGCDTSGLDTFIHIYDGSFDPANPATNFMVADDDSGSSAGCGLDPSATITLTAGQPYVIVYCAYSAFTTSISGITVSVSPPAGGGVQLGQIQWYTAASGGTLLGTGSTFNPVGVAGSGLADTNTAGTTTYYATNSLSSFCRTATTFVVNPKPTVNLSSGNVSVCSNSYTAITATGTANTYTWTSDVANTLYTNNTGTLYTPGTPAATVYVKSSSTVTVTATGTLTATGCTNTASVTFTIITKVWNGTWTPAGTPISSDSVVINANYSAGSFAGCSCKVNAGAVVFSSGENMSLQNELNVSGGSVTFNDGASLLQTNNVTNIGNITYKRNSQPCFRYDYSYWSSPVASTTLGAVSPDTTWDGFFYYDPAVSNWQAANHTTPMAVTKGYIIRVPEFGFNLFPGTPTVHALNFVGVPNNGTYSATIAGGSNQLNLIGNPYPSAISASAFVTDVANSSVVDATIYFWTHNTPITAGVYTNNDYAVWNLLGGVATHPAVNSGINNTTPTGYIAAGQGFFIKGLTSGTATFKNSMRLLANNDQFYKASTNSGSSLEASRLWLDVVNGDAGMFKQMMLGYVADGTLDMDRGLDSEMVDSGNGVLLYSMVGDKKLSIEGRGAFVTSDLIPLGFKSSVDGVQTISLSNFDGLFVGQDVYLEDTYLNTIQDLKQGGYTFSSLAGTYENRFVLRFTTTTLGLPTFADNTVVVYKNMEGIHVHSGVNLMKKVAIYDVTGRLIASRSAIHANETLFTNLAESQQMLLVQITSEEGEIVTKKILN